MYRKGRDNSFVRRAFTELRSLDLLHAWTQMPGAAVSSDVRVWTDEDHARSRSWSDEERRGSEEGEGHVCEGGESGAAHCGRAAKESGEGISARDEGNGECLGRANVCGPKSLCVLHGG